jgi:hypothetical protein
MKKYSRIIIAVFISMLIFLNGGITYAATFNFSPTSTEVRPDNTFDLQINVDALTDQIAGTDIYLSYDANLLEVQTITDGSYFPQVENVPSTGRLYITGFVNTQGDYKTGSGTVATVTFKALAEGNTEITIDCDTTQTDTSKIVQNDTAVTNILDCSSLQAHAVTISANAPDNGTSSSNTTTTTTASELPKSGVVEDMISYAIFGGILVGLGATIRILLRIM